MENKPQLKTVMQYLRTFAWMIVLLFGYALIAGALQEIPFSQILLNIWFLPIFMIGILIIYEKILARYFFKNKRYNPTTQFIQHVSMKAKEDLLLSKESFQELNKNETFQKELSEMYQLFLSKELDEKKYIKHLKPFSKDSTERAVLEIVIQEATMLLHQKESV